MNVFLMVTVTPKLHSYNYFVHKSLSSIHNNSLAITSSNIRRTALFLRTEFDTCVNVKFLRITVDFVRKSNNYV